MVSLSDNPDKHNGLLKDCPISKDIIKNWISKVDGFKLDNNLTFDSFPIIERLSKFWLPDETILYIGKAPIRSNGKGLGNRVNEFYRTKFGEKKPHAGGHWLKALSVLSQLFVYYIPCNNSGDIEIKMLKLFVESVSQNTKSKLYDSDLPLPFANLELRQRKNHGLSKMKI